MIIIIISHASCKGRGVVEINSICALFIPQESLSLSLRAFTVSEISVKFLSIYQECVTVSWIVINQFVASTHDARKPMHWRRRVIVLAKGLENFYEQMWYLKSRSDVSIASDPHYSILSTCKDIGTVAESIVRTCLGSNMII